MSKARKPRMTRNFMLTCKCGKEKQLSAKVVGYWCGECKRLWSIPGGVIKKG